MTDIENQKKWYTLRSKPNKEFSLERELIACDFKFYFPQLRVNPVNPRSRKVVPYFPGYLFINVDLQETGTRPLNRIPQSIGLIMFGDYVPPVSELLLRKIDRKLQSISNAGGLVFETLQNGDPVDIVSGAFEGYEAIFEERISGDDRVRVLLKMLSDRFVPVELEAGAIFKRT